jgi:hypothetical protein
LQFVEKQRKMSSKFSFVPARVQSTASRGVEVEQHFHNSIIKPRAYRKKYL